MKLIVLLALVLCSCGQGIGKPCKSGGDCASSYCRDGVCFHVHDHSEDFVPIFIYIR